VPTEVPAQRQEPDANVEDEATQGVYVISVTARILHMHPQTLRKYERLGLVNPSRSGGQIRYYSDLDISRLRMIKHLVEDRGMNLAGVELALEMVNRLQLMQQVMATQLGSDAQDTMQQLMTSVLDLLHYSDQDLRSVEPPTQA
jgi:MerR family transcriptional regulator/heat shock protein HspR